MVGRACVAESDKNAQWHPAHLGHGGYRARTSRILDLYDAYRVARDDSIVFSDLQVELGAVRHFKPGISSGDSLVDISLERRNGIPRNSVASAVLKHLSTCGWNV